MDITSLTAVELGKKIKAKEISVVEAVKASIAQIEKVEKDVNSFVTLDKEGALKRAEEVQTLIDDGTLTGPLAGVPVAIKDNMCTKGMLTTCSSKILGNFQPMFTAEAVKNLEAAGAVILGKTNMDEFAMGSTTETSHFGPTKNPWNLEHVPGDLRRKLCSGCSRRSTICTWIRYRRIYPSAKFVLWCSRNQTNIWNGIPLRTDRLWFFTGSDRAGCERCDGLCNNLRDDCIL